MLNVLFDIEDIKKRLGIWVTLIKDKNFISAFMLILLFYSFFQFKSYSGFLVNTIFIISFVILILLITYDFCVSYLIFKLNIFNYKTAGESLKFDILLDYLFGLSDIDGNDGVNKVFFDSIKMYFKKIIDFFSGEKVLIFFVPFKRMRKFTKLSIFSLSVAVFKGSISIFKGFIACIIKTIIPNDSTYNSFLHKYYFVLCSFFLKVPKELIKAVKAKIIDFFKHLHKYIFEIFGVFIYYLFGTAILAFFSFIFPFVIIYQIIIRIVKIVAFIKRIPTLLINFIKKVMYFFLSVFEIIFKTINYIWKYILLLISKIKISKDLLLLVMSFLLFFGFLYLVYLNLPSILSVTNNFFTYFEESKVFTYFEGNMLFNFIEESKIFTYFEENNLLTLPNFSTLFISLNINKIGFIVFTLLLISIYPLINKKIPQLTLSILSIFIINILLIFYGSIALILIPYIFYLSLTSNPVNKVIYLILITLFVSILPIQYQIITEYILITLLILTDHEAGIEFQKIFKIALSGDYITLSSTTNQEDTDALNNGIN